MKRVLMSASVGAMIYNFNMDNIEILQEMGYQVDVACNFSEKENIMPKEKIQKFKQMLIDKDITVFETDCPRKIYSIFKIIRTYFQMKKIMNAREYSLIYTQSPIGGVLGRLAARKSRKNGAKVIYTAHGFHFFKGGPLLSWLFFYPIEKFCSKYNDVLITINKEDYYLAQKKFYSETVKLIPGVGVDISRFKSCMIDKTEKRREMGIGENSFVLLSVGELALRKNHDVVIEAIGRINQKSSLNIVYVIAGQGELKEKYEQKAENLNVNLKLLGFRSDIEELCAMADVFVHPSIREGLGIAPLEAMASGLPLISSYINGIRDYTENNVSGMCVKDPTSVSEMESAILAMMDNDVRERWSENNKKKAIEYSIENSKKAMKNIFEEVLVESERLA